MNRPSFAKNEDFLFTRCLPEHHSAHQEKYRTHKAKLNRILLPNLKYSNRTLLCRSFNVKEDSTTISSTNIKHTWCSVSKMKLIAKEDFIRLASFLACVMFILHLPMVLAERQYINKFAVQIIGGEEAANRVATSHGYINHGKIGSLKDFFIFEHHEIQKRSLDYSHRHHIALRSEKEVLWAEQQYEKRRVKRDGLSDAREKRSLSKFPDPLFSEQWYLQKGAYGGNDMNVVPVWEQGITGKGVVVTILDDGIQTNHPDLIQNYDPQASSDINGGDDDPMPQDNGDNKHGTRCAGEVAATAFNDFCGVGIAYNSSIGGVRMLDGTVTDEVEARALSLNSGHIDIYSASWGPEDDGKTVDGPGRLAKSAFIDGITSGRQGKGSIFVWASGNGGRHQDNCNCDGYTNSIYTLSISSATQAGAKPWYLEECSSTLATTYSSGTPRQDENVVTVDMDMSYFRDLQNHRIPNPATLCTKSHTGTSASAPIAAAIAALALEANPKITWRDLQHLVVLTSRPSPLSREDGWVTNGVGRKVNHKFGYGLMDAAALVKLAQQWKNVPEQRSCHTPPDRQERQISSDYGERLEVTMVTDGCQGTADGIQYLEHVQVVITLQFLPRGHLHIILISPSGTPSSILLPRPFDTMESAITKWPFLSVHFWGENPNGQWKLIIVNEGRHRVPVAGKLKEWSLVFYGSERNPINLKAQNGRSRHVSSVVRQTDRMDDSMNQNPCALSGQYQKPEDSEMCLDNCPAGFFGDEQRLCKPCGAECDQCYGRGADHCLSCPGDKYLSKDDTCVTQCPDGYYADSLTRDCLPCQSSCATCFDAPEKCHSCKPKFFIYQQKCVSPCPRQTYQTLDSRCNACDPSCSDCTGPRNDECLYCSEHYFYVNGTCKVRCPDGYYQHTPTRACYRCSQGCETCNEGALCTSCFKDWTLDDDKGVCFLRDEDNCRHGYLSPDSNQCISCDASCKECTGSSQYSCTECRDKWLLHNRQCVQGCPNGFYQNERECYSCSLACTQCLAFDSCTSCTAGLVLQGDRCISNCDEGWYVMGQKCNQCHSSCNSCQGPGINNCSSCNYGTFLVNGACVESCPKGYYAGDPAKPSQECLACHHLCLTCTGPGPTSCKSCPKNAVLIDRTCYPCLAGEYFDKDKQSCAPCHSTCSQCSGSLETECVACVSPLKLKPDSRTCLPCCGLHESPSDAKCCSCNADSGLCGGYSDKTRSVVSFTDGTRSKLPFGKEGGLDSDELKIPMRNIVPVVVGICASAVLLFFIVFGILQASTSGFCKGRKGLGNSYKRVPVARYDGNSEKVALTQDDDDDEDDLFEKT